MIDLARIRVGEQLGTGGQGRVYLGLIDGTRLALKVIPLQWEVYEEVYHRVLDFGADLLDTRVVPILAAQWIRFAPPELAEQFPREAQDKFLLVMPFVDGATLSEILARGPLGLREGVAVLWGVARKLERLGKLGHGDLRAANVFVKREGEVLLSDQDLTRRPRAEEDLAGLGALGRGLLAKPENAALDKLLADLSRGELAPSAAEAAKGLEGVARELGIADPSDVLAERAAAVSPEPKAIERLVARVPKLRKPPGQRRQWPAGVLVVAIAVAGPWVWFHVERRIETQVSENPLLVGGSRPMHHDPGNVAYDGGGVHLLTGREEPGSKDGEVDALIREELLRIAILGPGHDVRYEEERPDLTWRRFSVTPGGYILEIDRAGVKPETFPFEVVVQDPTIRFLVSHGRIIGAPDELVDRNVAPGF